MKQSLHTLLQGLIDYAGLFPPAGLPMPEAARNYARYREAPHSFALARFVVPISRLAELEEAGAQLFRGAPWFISALAGEELESDAAAVVAFNKRSAGKGFIDTVEVKGASAGSIDAVSRAFPRETIYFEVDPTREELLDHVAAVGQRAKIRSGGLTAEAFPAADVMTRFIEACAKRGVAFKATAGLHHPLRCLRPLTYAEDAPRGVMHGFVNVFLAAAFLHQGMSHELATQLLLEEDASAFRFEPDRAIWRDHTVSNEQLSRTRERFAISFGSCSFEEPLEDLTALGWI